jgi:hypothetical protein
MVFSGFEYGVNVMTGAGLTTRTPASNPVREAYVIFQGPDRSRNSWDQITALFAARDFESDYFSIREGGSNHIFDDGSNEWRESPVKAHQSYIIPNDSSPHTTLTREVDALMEQPPQGMEPPPTSGERLQNPLTNMCLDIFNPSGNPSIPDYSNAAVFPCTGAGNQQWAVSGTGQLVNPPSGKCLDLHEGNNNSVQLFSCTGSSNQVWEAHDDSRIVNPSSGLCLTIRDCESGCSELTDVWAASCGSDTTLPNQSWDTSTFSDILQ